MLHDVGEGEIFGEIAALDGKERAADAVALAAILYTRDLLPTLSAHPPAMLEVLRGRCEKIRVAAITIEDNNLEMRWCTARGLLRLARQHMDARGHRAVRYSWPMHRRSLENIWELPGQMLIGSGELKSAKLIAISGTEITILDAGGSRTLQIIPPRTTAILLSKT